MAGRDGLPRPLHGDCAVRLTLPGLDPLDAVVDYLTPYFIGLRAAEGLYRFFGRNAWGLPISLGHHIFASDADQEKVEHAWREWLAGVFDRSLPLP